MKAILALLLLFPFALQAQDYEKLSEAFTNGDATSVGRMLDATIDYTEDG